MSIFQAIIYGIVQGIAEFLPISSTAHLALLPWLFGWKDPGVAFDVALHLGTAAAVIIFFFKDWINLIKDGFTNPKSKNGKLFWFVMLATIPGALFGVLLDKYMENFRNAGLIGMMLILMGVVLYYADKLSTREVNLENMTLRQSIVVGIAQVFAIIPGVSRSGITMSVGRILKIERESIAKFTFLLSTPIILGDGFYHAMKIGAEQINATAFLVAVATAAITGLLSIGFLLDYLKKKGFGAFAIYRFIIGALVIIVYFVRVKR